MSAVPAQLVVMAKVPVPGRVKTRLTPPFSPGQAAGLAAAALADTLATGATARFARRVLALADSGNTPGPAEPTPATPGKRPGQPHFAHRGLAWLHPDYEVTGQSGEGLGERIAAAMTAAHARLPVPVVLIGMDTPQVSTALLATAACTLAGDHADAVFGPASDGGYWLLGLRSPDPALLKGVPMSSASTGGVQLERLRAAGLRVCLLPELTDVDTVADAHQVAREADGSRFAALLRYLCQERTHVG